MAVNAEVINATASEATEILAAIGYLGIWLQAIGLIAILYIFFSIIGWYFHRKRLHQLYNITQRLEALEAKIDALLSKPNKKITDEITTIKKKIQPLKSNQARLS